MERPRLCIVQASLHGSHGNAAALLEHADFAAFAATELLVLAEKPGFERHRAAVARADAFLVVTGTYWDSWSSHLQQFLEEATPTEGTELWLGKPFAAWILCHSVGAKGVLSRLQGVLSTFGCTLPPMTGLVIAKATELARVHHPEEADFYGVPDLAVSLANLRACLEPSPRYRAWEVDRADTHAVWMPRSTRP